MSASRRGLVGRLRWQRCDPILAAAPHEEHDKAEDEQHNSPPQIGVDAEAASVELRVVVSGGAKGGEDDANDGEHQAHGNAEVEIHDSFGPCFDVTRWFSGDLDSPQGLKPNHISMRLRHD